MEQLITSHIERTISVLSQIRDDPAFLATLQRMAVLTAGGMRAGHKLLVAGNGGSAADAQHLVAEFVVRLTTNRPAMPAIALTTDSSVLTAIGNDFAYDQVFRRQLEAIAKADDIFLAVSTSGNSPSILRALEYCREAGIVSLGLTGNEGGKMKDLADHLLIVPSGTTAHIQETHLLLEHVFCGLVEREYFATARA